MHRDIMGVWVAWKPEMAPQATVMNMKGHTGRPSGWRFSRVSSGIWKPPAARPPTMPTAMLSSTTPNTG